MTEITNQVFSRKSCVANTRLKTTLKEDEK